MPHTKAAKRWRAIAVFLLVIAAMSLLVTLLILRARKTDLTAKRLCQVISQILITQDARLGSLSYYKHHPLELAQAHKDNHEILKTLNCSSSPPVSPQKGGPQ